MDNIIFIDTEVGVTDHKVHDIGAVSGEGSILHTGKVEELADFVGDTAFVCGHNLLRHDWPYLQDALEARHSFQLIDTLPLSPLLFPKRPYHALLKNDKLQTDELNNPVNDCKKAMALLQDEIAAFRQLPAALQEIFYFLLHETWEFSGFFEYLHYVPAVRSNRIFFGWFRRKDFGIKDFFKDRICANADVEALVRQHPVELAYALALIHAGDSLSVIPPWTLKNYPLIYNVIVLLCNRPCSEGCPYCQERLNAVGALRQFFGYSEYRTYDGEPLQEQAVQAAIDGKSLLVVFPTGGGKSITFQVPALMAGANAHGLTVVISPLQSLMKDQVDHLRACGIEGAVTVNGLLSPVERAEAFRMVADGTASLLYISPEMLRSKTVERMLLSRNVVRFVIDEAHCFSSWGQDFRIDYLYIGDFIQRLQQNKANGQSIAVSCFTATAKQKVISDIRDYFREKLDLDLEIYASNAARDNLTYNVLYKETEEDKYNELRNLIERKNCPTIIYVSRTRRTIELARKLTADGFSARPFNGKMLPKEKVENQEAFLRNEVSVIVATSAFGMGVDKSDIGLVVHYDISDSLENYIQESGRAGRDRRLQADCYVLYNETDLDKHFILLNQTRISQRDIQQIWQAIKRMTGTRQRICCSPLEIARMAGWDCSVADIETRVKTAIGALENTGYIRRGNNMPRVYATGILVRNMEEAVEKINRSALLTTEEQRNQARRIIKSLISSRSRACAGNEDAESRVDYLADMLGIQKAEVINVINLLREEGVLADSQDMSAYLLREDTNRRSSLLLERLARLERFLLTLAGEGEVCEWQLKEINARALEAGIASANVKDIRTLLHFLCVKQYIRKEEFKGTGRLKIVALLSREEMLRRLELRLRICRFLVERFYELGRKNPAASAAGEERSRENRVDFSLVTMYNRYRAAELEEKVELQDVQDALLYLSTIGAIRLEGGFLVLYNGMEINRLVMDNRIRYKREDYAGLNEFYKQKIQQIHIVGAFANMMVKDYRSALQFVQDYFLLDYRRFVGKYFEASQIEALSRNMTSRRYEQLFGCLSQQQKAIIDDDESKHIVVVAGPGSGKTRVLVHKLAAMLTLEDVKHEQLLMVTFSRAAATEFKMRLKDLIGNAANFVEIKTFHSYCFDLMGKIGNLEDSGDVVKRAVQMIQAGEVEPERISKSVLVIDEAQDMDQDEFALVQALMSVNEGMRVIAVGDDDQNIFEFRGSDSKYMRAMVRQYDARMYELVENYRSKKHIVSLSNTLARQMRGRLKNKEVFAASDEAGEVEMVRYESCHLQEPLVQALKAHRTHGSACVMTATNEEVSSLLGILLKHGIRAQLIQSTDGFSLYNLAEIRFFLKKLQHAPHQSAAAAAPLHPVIAEDDWNRAKEELRQVYKDSKCLPNCLKMIAVFEALNERKYRSDLEEFIRESNYEDFYEEEQGVLYVSTIHKTKGREFDQVYLLLNQLAVTQEADLRKLYVAMTRARSALYIHYCGTPVIDSLAAPFALRHVDTEAYTAPDEIVLQLTHKDVYLDYFKDKKRVILQLQSGSRLTPGNRGLLATVGGCSCQVLLYSKSFAGKLEQLERRGYFPVGADVRLVVAWKGADDEGETAVLLPNLLLKALRQ